MLRFLGARQTVEGNATCRATSYNTHMVKMHFDADSRQSDFFLSRALTRHLPVHCRIKVLCMLCMTIDGEMLNENFVSNMLFKSRTLAESYDLSIFFFNFVICRGEREEPSDGRLRAS